MMTTMRLLSAAGMAVLGWAALAGAAAARAPAILDGRFSLNIRIVHAKGVYDRRAGQHMERTLRIRRNCHAGACRYRFAIEDKFGTFTYFPLRRVSSTRYVGREIFRRECRTGGTSVANAEVRLHVTATSGQYVSRLEGTMRSRSVGCGLPGYESWTMLGSRTDLPE
jgi:hypothetical protein